MTLLKGALRRGQQARKPLLRVCDPLSALEDGMGSDVAVKPQLFPQNVIAMVWDFDKTLIPGNMQGPLFRHFGVDED
jgi:hypothetical protein